MPAPTHSGAQLTHVDKRVRDSAVAKLRTWLVQQPQCTRLQLLKLWKGLFYCYWMSDIARIQHELADNLAQIASDLGDQQAAAYLEAFWATTTREWGSIDRHRLDKYYYLMGAMRRAGLCFLARALSAPDAGAAEAIVALYAQLVAEGPLCRARPQVAAGVQYHAAESALAEFNRIVAEEEIAEADHARLLEWALAPFVEAFLATDASVLQTKIFQELFLAATAEPKAPSSKLGAAWTQLLEQALERVDCADGSAVVLGASKRRQLSEALAQVSQG